VEGAPERDYPEVAVRRQLYLRGEYASRRFPEIWAREVPPAKTHANPRVPENEGANSRCVTVVKLTSYDRHSIPVTAFEPLPRSRTRSPLRRWYLVRPIVFIQPGRSISYCMWGALMGVICVLLMTAVPSHGRGHPYASRAYFPPSSLCVEAMIFDAPALPVRQISPGGLETLERMVCLCSTPR